MCRAIGKEKICEKRGERYEVGKPSPVWHNINNYAVKGFRRKELLIFDINQKRYIDRKNHNQTLAD